jgi:hypothetical protein
MRQCAMRPHATMLLGRLVTHLVVEHSYSIRAG